MTGIHIACKEGYKDIVQEIVIGVKSKKLNSKELFNLTDNRGWTPLFYTIDGSENGFPEIVGRFQIKNEKF